MVHTAIITVTNSLGHGITVTNQFDTFNQTNYMFEAEDFDFNGGQYVSANDYYPDVYDQYASVSDIDYQHTYITDEPTDGSEYQYRQNGIPQQLLDVSGALSDYQRQISSVRLRKIITCIGSGARTGPTTPAFILRAIFMFTHVRRGRAPTRCIWIRSSVAREQPTR